MLSRFRLAARLQQVVRSHRVGRLHKRNKARCAWWNQTFENTHTPVPGFHTLNHLLARLIVKVETTLQFLFPLYKTVYVQLQCRQFQIIIIKKNHKANRK